MDILKKFGVKKIIALTMVVAFIIFTAYSLHTGKELSESFVTTATMIIAYYFGRSHGEEK